MSYTLGNKYAKNLCKQTVLLQLIIENVVTCFSETQCSSEVLVLIIMNSCLIRSTVRLQFDVT